MLSAWTVAINLITRSNFGLVANNMARQSGQLEQRTGRLKNSINMAGKAFNTLGLAAAASTAIGVRGAAELQQSLSRLAVQSGSSIDSIRNKYQDLVMTISGRTGMSLSDAFSVVNQVGGVIKDPRELRASIMGDPRHGGMIDLTTVLNRSGVSSSSPSEIARNVITADHILNAYRQADMAHVNERLYRAAVGSHMDLGALVTQLGYYGEQFRLAGQGRKTAVDDVLTLGELGYWGIGHGKWGSGFGQILRQITRMPKNARPALRDLGIIDANNNWTSTTVDANNNFTPMAMISAAIARTYGRGMGPMQIQQLLNEAFPANAARVMAEAMSPKTQGFVHRLQANEGHMPSLMAAEAQLLNNLNDQTEILWNNFKNLNTILQGPLTDGLTKIVTRVNQGMTSLIQFFQGHPTAAGVTGGVMAAFGAVTAIRVAMWAWQANAAFFTLSSSMNVLSASALRAHIGVAGLSGALGQSGIAGAAGTARLGVLGLMGTISLFAAACIAAAGLIVLANHKLGSPDMNLGPENFDPSGYDTSGAQYRGVSAKQLVRGYKKPLPVFHSTPQTQFGPALKEMPSIQIKIVSNFVAPENTPEMKRAAKQYHRDLANTTAEVMSKVLRTGAKAAGPVASSFGMSHLELHGTNA